MFQRFFRYYFIVIPAIVLIVAPAVVPRQVAYGQESAATRVTALIEGLREADATVSQKNALALAEIGETGVPALIGALRDPSANLRHWAAFALARIGPGAANAVPALRDTLEDPDATVRQQSAFALGAIGKTAVPALVEALRDPNAEVRHWAAFALARIGPGAANAVPALRDTLEDPDATVRQRATFALWAVWQAEVPALIEALRDPSVEARQSAALALGRIGPGAGNAMPALRDALNDRDATVQKASALALGQIGRAADSAVPALIEALRGRDDPAVRGAAATALGGIGKSIAEALRDRPNFGWPHATIALSEGKVALASAVSTLMDSVSFDLDVGIRGAAAAALGQIGLPAAAAVPVLTKALGHNHLGHNHLGLQTTAAEALADIAGALQDDGATSHLPELREARDVLNELLKPEPDKVPELANAATDVRRAVDSLEEQYRWMKVIVGFSEFVETHPYTFAFVVAYFLLTVIWLLLYWLRPLAILRINGALRPYEFTLPRWLGSVKVPLAPILLIGFFHHKPRVLDAWVQAHVDTVRQRFAERDTVRDRAIHVDVPVILDGMPDVELSGQRLRSVFSRHVCCLLIQGEGGSGKTSLACCIAQWAMADDPTERLCDHRMLPVLIEQDLEVPLQEAVGGQLQRLADEANPIAPDLLEQLLRHRRVLVIIDHLSEMSAATRAKICLDAANFPANALIVTSRLEERLTGASMTVIHPPRLDGNGVSYFLEIYLIRRGARSLFDLEEYFEGCRRLAALAGDRAITVLLAKLYAEKLIARKQGDSEGDLPDTIPDLMLAYLNELNCGLSSGDKLDDRIVHHDAKALAWECLVETYRPGSALIDDARSALGGEDPDGRLRYLEERLRLIRTMSPAKDRVRFLLDPLAEYLAGLNRVEAYGADDEAWHQFLTEADNKEGAPKAVRGFMLAVRDCCLANRKKTEIPAFVERELAARASLDQ